MATKLQSNFTIRKDFSNIKSKLSIPGLIDIQKQSYKNFLQLEFSNKNRTNIGLQSVFKSVFPIKDYNETASLEFVSYSLDNPKYDVYECCSRGMTFAFPIKIVVRLVLWDKDEKTQIKTIRDIKEQEIYFGELPKMTDYGTFIINGTERVVVSQLHRSPGVFFDNDRGRTHSSGKLLYNARIIPYRGSWLDFEFDHKDLLYCRIDRRRKFYATILLKALGFSIKELLAYYYHKEVLFINNDGTFAKAIDFNFLLGQRSVRDVFHPRTAEKLVKKNRKFTSNNIKKMKEVGLTRLTLTKDEVLGLISADDVVNNTGEVLWRCNEALSDDILLNLQKHELKKVEVLYIDGLNVGSYFRDTWVADKIISKEEAMIEIYRRLRPGDPPTLETAEHFIKNLFFNKERYDLSEVGRLKLNHKFLLRESLNNRLLTKNDILEVIRYLIELRNGNGCIDDIDHLGNRRVRAVGELIENQYRIGLVRMERAIKERMSIQEVDTLMMPHDLINNKPVAAVVKEFFGSSQLSQFMDQTNPLSEVTHKRRLSALGPGGLTRERAGFEVRDVHPTHYGRICPIETPEGQNIGLIASLSTYARVNKYGFVETPYRRVKNGYVTNEVKYYSALQEENEIIAQATEKIDIYTNKFVENFVQVRKAVGTTLVSVQDVSLMEISPNQLVSIAAGLIPFLEHDDANRALMGSNMQRQAVPLLQTDSPIVGTGMEAVVGKDSGVCKVSKSDGIVDYVDSSRIVIRVISYDKTDFVNVDVYNLRKFQRSNQNTCFNQKAIVSVGDKVNKGDVIADGPATDCGELALGCNVSVAFMPWHGYNFEDSILVSERLLKEDLFTSIHIEEFECVARDTKLGAEEITPDIPNVGDEGLKNLDKAGIVCIGASVKAGDILVGKITPKGETQLSPEEKLLRAIFGEKAGDVRDTSLRIPPGTKGTVIDANIFTRKGAIKDIRAINKEEEVASQLLKDQNDEIRIIKNSSIELMIKLLKGNIVEISFFDRNGNIIFKKGDVLKIYKRN